MCNEKEWCVDCGARFTEDEIANSSACPKCGSVGIPCDTAQDVRVEVNWHELRILGIWAENWARHCADKASEWDDSGKRMPKTVSAICRRLQAQRRDLIPLTLSEEIAELPRKLAEGKVEISGMETNIAKPPLFVAHGPGAVGHGDDHKM